MADNVQAFVQFEDVASTEKALDKLIATADRKDHVIGRSELAKLVEDGTEKVAVRSVLKCQAVTGVCQACYGVAPATGQLVQIGDALGKPVRAINDHDMQGLGAVAGEGVELVVTL